MVVMMCSMPPIPNVSINIVDENPTESPFDIHIKGYVITSRGRTGLINRKR